MVDYGPPADARTLTPNPAPGDPLDPEQARENFALFYVENRSLALVVLRVALAGTGIDAADIASRMWMKIWQKWREHGPMVEAARAYVRHCARNAAVDALRTGTDLLLADMDELDTLTARRPADGDGEPVPGWPVPFEQDRPTPPEPLTDPQLIAAVQELTPVERLVILTWIETFPPPTSAQIAQHLKIPASTVRGHRMRAIKKLRDICGELDHGKGGVGR